MKYLRKCTLLFCLLTASVSLSACGSKEEHQPDKTQTGKQLNTDKNIAENFKKA